MPGYDMIRLLALCFLALVAPSGAEAREEIVEYQSDIVVFAEGHMEVTETLRVRAEGDAIRRGIYRDFPTRYTDRLGNRYHVGFDVLAVTRNGQGEDYHTESRSNGVRVYIGHADRMLEPGVHTYTLSYRTDRQLGFFDGHDELYWNVTGNDWAFPILSVEASVSLPTGVPVDGIRVEGYTGFGGDTGQDYRALVDARGVARFSTTRPLAPGEGFTLVVTWPPGHVERPDAGDRAARFFSDNLSWLVGMIGLLVVLAYYLFAWHRHGRDPEGGVVIPLYEPPAGYSPASMRFIHRMGYDHKAFASALVNLAVKGIVEIDEAGKHFVVKRTGQPADGLAPGEQALIGALFLSRQPGAAKTASVEQLLERLPGESRASGLVPRLVGRLVEQGVRHALSRADGATGTAAVGGGATDSVVLERKNHSRIRAALKAHEASLKNDYDRIYFRSNTGWILPGVVLSLLTIAGTALALDGDRRLVTLFMSAWLSFWSIGVFALTRRVLVAWRGARSVMEWVSAAFASLFALPFVIGEIAGFTILAVAGSPGAAVVLLVAVAINALFFQWLKAPTRAGRDLLDRVEGFRLFLDVAEKEEMNLRHPPEKTPELFERYLPYAMALDVEHRWAERFAGLFRRLEEEGRGHSPRWYRGRRFNASDIGGFSSAMGSSLGAAIASSSTAPGSSSGAGGGGSSGGGGGGGGGGGW